MFSLCFTVVIGTPTSIYLSNIGEFTLPLRDLTTIAAISFFGILIPSTIIVILLPHVTQKRLTSLFVALSVLCWFQSSIIVWQYGPLDGREIQWNRYWINGLIDTPIWLAVLVLSVSTPAPFLKIARTVAVFLILAQLVTLTAKYVKSAPERELSTVTSYSIDEKEKYTFSKTLNVVLIVLDAFQADIFQEIVEADKSYSATFDGFVYYRNALSASNYTELAVPGLLTGQLYDNSIPKAQFLKQSFQEWSIFHTLKQHAFIVSIFPWTGWGNESVYLHEDIATNVVRRIHTGNRGAVFTEKNAKEFLHLIDLSLFRCSPHFLKRYIHNRNNWFVYDLASRFAPQKMKQFISTDNQFEAATFLTELGRNFDVGTSERMFKYFHLKGPHRPFMVNQNLELTNQTFEYNRANYIAQAKASLRALDGLFQLLKDQGIYDTSMILVVGDHGSGITKEMYVNPDENTNIAVKPNITYARDFHQDKSRGIPLILVKRRSSRGKLVISDQPVSLLDVPATILNDLGLEHDQAGQSMFSVDPDSTRARQYAAINFGGTKSDYLSPITVYTVSGHSWSDDSWKVTQVWSPPNTATEGQ
jgi:hypothetical protein